MTDPSTAKGDAPAALPTYSLITAGVILLLYVGLTLALIFRFADEPRDSAVWDHVLLIYNGFTAFAVAAGGVLLGTQIQQANVTAARRDAAEAKAECARLKQAIRSAVASSDGIGGGGAAGNADLQRVRSVLVEAL